LPIERKTANLESGEKKRVRGKRNFQKTRNESFWKRTAKEEGVKRAVLSPATLANSRSSPINQKGQKARKSVIKRKSKVLGKENQSKGGAPKVKSLI